MKVAKFKNVVDLGFSHDRRRRRRQHRDAAKELLFGSGAGLMNGMSARGSTTWWAAQWHLYNARYL